MAKLHIMNIRREDDASSEGIEQLIFEISAQDRPFVRSDFVVVETVKTGAPISQKNIDNAEKKVRELASRISEAE